MPGRLSGPAVCEVAAVPAPSGAAPLLAASTLIMFPVPALPPTWDAFPDDRPAPAPPPGTDRSSRRLLS